MIDEKPVDDIRAGRQEFIWKGPLYEKTNAPAWYYVALILIGIALGAAFLYVQQPLSAVVIGASLLFFITHANEIPKALRYSITDKGVGIEDELRSYNGLKSFWISESPRLNTLYIEQAGRILFPLSIPIQRADVAGIRTLLRRHIPESKRTDELFMDIIARLTGLI